MAAKAAGVRISLVATASKFNRMVGKLARVGTMLCLAAWISSAAFSIRAEADEYRLRPGDKISVAVLGQKELTGDMTVDDAGNIRMLIVGKLKVSDSTIAEVERHITDQLADGYLKNPIVSVRIAELRPLYILGSVRKAGQYPYTFGSTVKRLMAIAGGIGLPDTDRPSVAEYLTAGERVGELTQTKEALEIRIARLEAQRDGLSSFAPKIPPDASKNYLDVVKREQEAFESQKKILESQLATVREQRPRLQSQIDALNGELASETKQVELARSQVEKYEELRATGLARNVTLVEYKQSQVRHESERWRIIGELSRLKYDQGELDVKLSSLVSSYNQKVIEELDLSRQNLKKIDVSLPSAVDIRRTRLAQIGSLAAGDDAYTIRVTRALGGKTFDATESTALEPGDIVEIKMNTSKARASIDPTVLPN